jgi:hypothetical protein
LQLPEKGEEWSGEEWSERREKKKEGWSCYDRGHMYVHIIHLIFI